MLTPIIFLLLIFVGMYFVCGELERACGNTAHRFGIPESIAGATLLAVASSAPEFFTSFLGAVRFGVFEVGLMAILWSAIFNITVIPGVSAIASKEPLTVFRTVVVRDAVAYLVVTLLLLALLQDGILSRTDAVILLGGYAVYIYVLVLMMRQGKSERVESMEQPAWRTIAGLVGGIAAIGLLCHFMIEQGKVLANVAGLNFLIVSALIFAPGTSVPDLFLSFIAARRGAGSAAIANAFGSNTFDLTVCLAVPVLVVGDTKIAMAGPVQWSVWMLVGTVVTSMFFVKRGYSLTRFEGGSLIALFVGQAIALVLLV
jgi:cation:H+ antiporter